jgi:ribosome maturation factor RimP
MIDKKQITAIASKHLEGTDKYVVNVQVKPGNVITIVIDSDTSLLIGDCSHLSKAVESSLDRDKEDFELRVTSYGADKPLKLKRQYKKNIGRELEVIKNDEQKLRGKLVEVAEEAIIIEPVTGKKKKSEIAVASTINFDEIMQSKVILSFK